MEHLRVYNHMAEMTEIRCKKCKGLLFKADGKASEIMGYIEIKCRKCGSLNGWKPPLHPLFPNANFAGNDFRRKIDKAIIEELKK